MNFSLDKIAGISQVRWNKSDPNILATAHDAAIRIWDSRVISKECIIYSVLATYH